MTLIDNATLTLQNDVDGDGTPDVGVFEFETNVELQHSIRTSFLLDNSLDRVLGALNEIQGKNNAKKRSGVTIDTGGGSSLYRLSFTESDGGTNSWGDGDNAITDATGDSARRKADVLMRYAKTGTYGSSSPAQFQFGEYNSSGGEYEDFIPVAIQDIEVNVSAEGESSIDGTVTLVEVGPLGKQSSLARNNK